MRLHDKSWRSEQQKSRFRNILIIADRIADSNIFIVDPDPTFYFKIKIRIHTEKIPEPDPSYKLCNCKGVGKLYFHLYCVSISK